MNKSQEIRMMIWGLIIACLLSIPAMSATITANWTLKNSVSHTYGTDSSDNTIIRDDFSLDQAPESIITDFDQPQIYDISINAPEGMVIQIDPNGIAPQIKFDIVFSLTGSTDLTVTEWHILTAEFINSSGPIPEISSVLYILNNGEGVIFRVATPAKISAPFSFQGIRITGSTTDAGSEWLANNYDYLGPPSTELRVMHLQPNGTVIDRNFAQFIQVPEPCACTLGLISLVSAVLKRRRF